MSKRSKASTSGNSAVERVPESRVDRAVDSNGPVYSGEGWTLVNGDSCEELPKLAENSVDLSVYSPPFSSLYTYSASEKDIGNCSTHAQFLEHLGYVIAELLRVTKPGRLTCCHIAQVTSTKATRGVIGLIDLRGAMVKAFTEAGWIYHGDICIDKDPQALRNGTPVLTPNGWKPIEALSVGEAVIGSDGCSTTVRGVYPHENKPMLARETERPFRPANSGVRVKFCAARYGSTAQTRRSSFRQVNASSFPFAGQPADALWVTSWPDFARHAWVWRVGQYAVQERI